MEFCSWLVSWVVKRAVCAGYFTDADSSFLKGFVQRALQIRGKKTELFKIPRPEGILGYTGLGMFLFLPGCWFYIMCLLFGLEICVLMRRLWARSELFRERIHHVFIHNYEQLIFFLIELSGSSGHLII